MPGKAVSLFGPAWLSAGSSMAARIAMIAITTRSSISVNDACLSFRFMNRVLLQLMTVLISRSAISSIFESMYALSNEQK